MEESKEFVYTGARRKEKTKRKGIMGIIPNNTRDITPLLCFRGFLGNFSFNSSLYLKNREQNERDLPRDWLEWSLATPTFKPNRKTSDEVNISSEMLSISTHL